MTPAELAAFLADVAPVLGLRTRPYQRLGGTVRKRLGWRLRELALADLAQYRRYLDAHPEEWAWLDASCRITISRFGRDAAAFAELVATLLPERVAAAVARGERRLAVHCAGAASGEEPYSIAIAFRLMIEPHHPGLELDVLGTDVDPLVLARADRASYPWGSLHELPDAFRAEAFEPDGGHWALRSRFRAGVRFERRDLRRDVPSGPFDLVTCRNVAFTYFDEPLQRQVGAALAQSLVPGGVLMLGKGEQLPDGIPELAQRRPELYERVIAGASVPLSPQPRPEARPPGGRAGQRRRSERRGVRTRAPRRRPRGGGGSPRPSRVAKARPAEAARAAKGRA